MRWLPRTALILLQCGRLSVAAAQGAPLPVPAAPPDPLVSEFTDPAASLGEPEEPPWVSFVLFSEDPASPAASAVKPAADPAVAAQPAVPASAPSRPDRSPVAASPSPVPVETVPDQPAKQSNQSNQDVPYHWLDRTREILYNGMWRSAEHVDRWFGSVEDDTVYQQIYGSIAPAMLYTQYDHLRTQLRFNMNIPLPQVNDRFHAFIGRFDPNEFITERDEPSGVIARTYGPQTEDQTLFGIGYHQPPKQGSRLDAGVGVRVALPMDPYIKGSYIYEHGASEVGLFSVRETLFWQNSDGAGETTRFDLERIFNMHWLVRYTASGTRSQESQGLRGYSSLLVLRGFPSRRAVAWEVGIDGQTEAPVPLHDYGMKVAYRQGILRRWLILEVRTSIDWPKDFIYQRRSASLGLGLGFEMLLGTSEFLARPVTF